jgi:hypothetical protein
MKKLLKKSIISISALPLILTGCFEDPTAPTGPSQISVTFALPKAFTTSSLSTLPNWTSGKAIIDRVEFQYNTPSGDLKQTMNTPTTIDLSTGIADPALPSMTLQAGMYKHVKFRAFLRSNGQTNFEVNGTWQNTPVKVEFDQNKEIKGEVEDLFIDQGRTYKAKIAIEPNVWFSKAELNDTDLQNATKDADGKIVINKTVNTSLYDNYIKNRFDEVGSFRSFTE